MGAPSLRSSLLEDHFAHYSALRDFNEVMPVLLPSHFRPGPAQSTERLLPSGATDVDYPQVRHDQRLGRYIDELQVGHDHR